jgi:DNA-binding HxlR family transcriptional regulator
MGKIERFVTSELSHVTSKTTDFVKILGSKTIIYPQNTTKVEKMGARTGFGDEVEDIIIQVLGHKERRNILKILSSSEDGATYSEILGETGLSTGRLNYHLKELEGFIDRSDDRRYVLTVLGRKALHVLDNIHEDLDETYENYVSATRTARRSFIKKNLDRGFYLFAGIFVVGSIIATYALITKPNAWWMLSIIYLFSFGMIYLMDRARKKSPKYLMDFIDWLDWKLFGSMRNENGLTRFRGSKLGVCLILGLLVGMAVGKTGLGLLLGFFFGFALEISNVPMGAK